MHRTDFHVILASVVNIASNVAFALICIYGDPYHRDTSKIWDNITSFVYDNQGSPILCMGDLNDLLYDVDKSSPIVNKYRMHAFCSIVKNYGFFDLGYSGPAYTWSNKRYTSKPTMERLDKCLVNVEWCGVFPNSNVFNLPIIYSDHAPILLSTETQMRKPRRNFKFENWWILEKDFHAYAKDVWLNSRKKTFHNRTTNLAGALRTWCRKKRSIQQELDSIGEQIKSIQMQPPQALLTHFAVRRRE